MQFTIIFHFLNLIITCKAYKFNFWEKFKSKMIDYKEILIFEMLLPVYVFGHQMKCNVCMVTINFF